MEDVNELNTHETVIGVPRCVECNRLYKKSDANEHGLCPKCLAEKFGTVENGEEDAISANHEPERREAAESENVKQEEIKVRPGQVIREAFLKLVADSKITESVLTILTDQEAAAKELGIRYAFLKEFQSGVPIKELTYIKGHARYSSKPIDVNGKQYLVTNDLYNKNVQKFMKWVDSIG